MLEVSRFVPMRPRNLQGPFVAVKLNKRFTVGCYNNFNISCFYRNLVRQLNRASTRDPPRRTD